MSEPDSSRWLSDLSDELRRGVPVRPAWRARLLEEIAGTPPPTANDAVDARFGDAAAVAGTPLETRSRRSIVLSPFAGLAAAIFFAAVGAAVTYMVVAPRPTAADRALSSAATSPPTRLTSDSPASTDREVVRFELSAPRASRVMLVGSFNEWDPSATPLARDASSGKWTVALRLPPGRHVYAFVVDGDVTADPSAPRAADDDFGSTNSVVLVSAPRT